MGSGSATLGELHQLGPPFQKILRIQRIRTELRKSKGPMGMRPDNDLVGCLICKLGKQKLPIRLKLSTVGFEVD